MVVMRRSSEADFVFVASDYDGELRVLRFNGTEALSEPFRYSLRLAAQDSEIDFETIIGTPAYLSIYGETGERYVNGIVTRFSQGNVGNRYTVYNAELMPTIYLLSMRYKCRIFQDMSVQDIIEQIFEEANIQSDCYRFALQGNHPAREYCVQYRESELNFISRLMEEEGIFYFFEHDNEKHVMVIADNPDVHVEIENSTIVFNEASNMVADQESIYEYRFIQQIRPSVVSLRDFNFEQPSLGGMDVMALAGEKAPYYEGDLEVYDYPGEYTEQKTGSDLAQIKLEVLRRNRQIGSGSSVCRRFLPGYKFTMDQHPRSDFNQEYLITKVTSSATQPLGEDLGEGLTYNNEFECIPASVPFRPPRKAIRPLVEGVQTAIVVGPSGEEIYTDEHGRVKVQFHWDREGLGDENSSCWIRVSQGWAGLGWGTIFIPRIGQEVIVDFLEGDPDRPIITGRVYNGENIPPYELPNEKTKSTIKSESSKGGDGYNEIRFEDNKGNEEIFIHAQKNMNQVIENNMSTSVGSNQSTSVGNDQSINVKHDRTKTVENDQTETIGNNKTIDVGNDHFETITHNKIVSVGNDHTEVISNNMSILINNNLEESVSVDYTEIVGGNMSLEVGSDYEETVTSNKTVSVGSDLTISVSGNSGLDTNGNIGVSSGGNITEQAGGNWEAIASSALRGSGMQIQLNANTQVQITCGGSTIQMSPANITLSSGSGQIILDPSGVTIVGAIVKIN
ncbi:MAG: type VI secretion system Vgr family protein [bacterium]